MCGGSRRLCRLSAEEKPAGPDPQIKAIIDELLEKGRAGWVPERRAPGRMRRGVGLTVRVRAPGADCPC